jgi:ankyrin repeat protein
MLQASSDLLEAAQKGQVQRVKALLLNGADPEARNTDVRYSSCICIFGIDTAYVVHEKHGSACFCCNHVCDGVLLVAKACVAPWQPASACLLQGRTVLALAAIKAHLAVVQTLLLNSADPNATSDVSCNSALAC